MKIIVAQKSTETPKRIPFEKNEANEHDKQEETCYTKTLSTRQENWMLKLVFVTPNLNWNF